MLNIKNKINNIRKSKDGSTVVKNFGYLTLLQIAGYFFPLITMPYLARVIGANGFGRIAFAAAIISWIQTIADWGFNYTATRDVARNRDDKNFVSEIFSNVLWARCILALVSLVVLSILVWIIPSFRENYLIIYITYLMIPGHILFPDWFFQAVEKMKYITLFNLFVKLIFTLLVFVVIRKETDYIYQPLFATIAYILCGFGSLWLITHKWGYSIRKPNPSKIYSTIKESTDVFINNLMPNLYNSFSVMLLGIYCGPTANGFFDGGNKFNSVAYQFHSVISRAFFPFLSRRIDKTNLFTTINIVSGVIVSISLMVFAPLIVKVMLDSEFYDSIIVLRILAFSMIFMVLSSTYGTNYLIIVKKERLLRNVTIACSVIGMSIAYPLVTAYSYVGAAITVLISRMLLGLITFFAAMHIKQNVKS